MTNSVDKKPTYSTLDQLTVGRDTRGAHVQRWANDLDNLLSYGAMHNVCSTMLQPLTSAVVIASPETHVQYWKSPFARVLLIETELQTSQYTDKLAFINVVPLFSGSTWVGTSSFDAAIPSGSRIVHYPHTASSFVPVTRGYLDVTNVTTGSVLDFKITTNNLSKVASADVGQGVYRVNIMEVPQTRVNPATSPTTEPSVNEAWAVAGQFIYEGSSSLPYGTQRVIDQLDKARDGFHKHWQIATHNDANRTWLKGASPNSGSINWQMGASGSERLHLMKARNMYGTTSTIAGAAIRAWYKTNSITGSYDLEFHVRLTGSTGPFTTYGYSLSPSTTWTTAIIMGGILPTTGTNSEFEFYFDGNVVGTGCQVQFQNIALVEHLNASYLSDFTQPKTEGLLAWFDAGSGYILDGASNRVSAWVDRMNNFVAVQATTASMPVYSASVVNGHPVIDFSGSKALPFAGLPLLESTVVAVYKLPTVNSASHYLLGGTDQGYSVGGTTALRSKLMARSGSIISEATHAPTGSYVIVTWLQNPLSLDYGMYVNSVIETNVSASGVGVTMQPTVIGGLSDITGSRFNGQLAELLVYTRYIPPFNAWFEYYDYLSHKYNI